MIDFTPGFDSNSLFQNQWSIIQGKCDSNQQNGVNYCKTSVSTYINIFSPDQKLCSDGFKVEVQAQQQPYQFTYANIFCFVTASDLIDFNLVDQANMVSKQLLINNGDLQNQQYASFVNCNGRLNPVIRFSLSIYSTFMSNNPVVSFTYARQPKNRDQFDLLKIVIWSNCVENCLNCQDNSNCKVCMKGFSLQTITDRNRVCEETINCKIANCFSCIKDSILNQNKCLKCNPGDKLDSKKNKIAQCKQVSGQQNQWQNCNLSVNTSITKCPKEKTVLIYELKHQQVFTCDCQVDFFEVCSKDQTFDQCKIGYQFNSDQTFCSFNQCPEGYSQDPHSGFCISNCPGINYLTCNNSQCLGCLSDANYYIDQTNLKNYIQCNIINCLSCSGDANYLKSQDQSQCNCNMNGCLVCEQSDGSKCISCALNYILSNNKCQCQVKDCKVCSQTDGSKCEICNDEFINNKQNNTCQCAIENTNKQNCISKIQNCQNCDPCNGSKCLLCQVGFVLDSNNQCNNFNCLCKVQNCNTCLNQDSYTYQACNKGYEQNNLTKKCNLIRDT
ncbi:hypothetical protein ABPG72_008870 [Tetrahymena utriculariae]